MTKNYPRPYLSWQNDAKRLQTEYTTPTNLLNPNGELNVKGYAKHNIFNYDRNLATPKWRGKEWDFYQISDGKMMLQISTANISIGGYSSASLVDLTTGKRYGSGSYFLCGKNKVILPPNGDQPNYFEYQKGKVHAKYDTQKDFRILDFDGKSGKDNFIAHIKMDFLYSTFGEHQNITIVTPFQKPNRFFMTMKQNCMPAEGYVKIGNFCYNFDKQNTFAVLDWGRGVWPHDNVWYWGNGAKRIIDSDGKEHIFGFEITWGIGNEKYASETCLFYDGIAHKIGNIDTEPFIKGHWMDEWHFVSEDKRFEMTMKPFFDNHTGFKLPPIVGMHCHQVHGLWNGKVVLDDGKVLEIKDMYAFCEYVENLW